MTDTPKCRWQGASGNYYTYWVYRLPPNFVAKPGNYVFAKLNADGQWVPVYIGQTDNLSTRFDWHHAMKCIAQNGATHIHAHVNEDRSARHSEEHDLIAAYNTSCNIAA